jgi:uncharacterized protein with GYD domain
VADFRRNRWPDYVGITGRFASDYAVVVTVEMPNGETMTKYAMAIAGTGNARTTTVRGYSPEEFSKLAAEAPSM